MEKNSFMQKRQWGLLLRYENLFGSVFLSVGLTIAVAKINRFTWNLLAQIFFQPQLRLYQNSILRYKFQVRFSSIRTIIHKITSIIFFIYSYDMTFLPKHILLFFFQHENHEIYSFEKEIYFLNIVKKPIYVWKLIDFYNTF